MGISLNNFTEHRFLFEGIMLIGENIVNE